jgi:hypothetical protein
MSTKSPRSVKSLIIDYSLLLIIDYSLFITMSGKSPRSVKSLIIHEQSVTSNELEIFEKREATHYSSLIIHYFFSLTTL